MINCRWGVNQLGIFAWRENVRNSDVVVRAENIATDVLFGLRYPRASSPRGRGGTHYSRKRSFLSPSGYGEKGGRRRGGSDWCAGQEAAREWWIETKRRLRNPVAVAARERKKGTDGSSPQTTLITDSVYDIPGSESDHYGERHAEDAHSCVLPRVARNKNDASRSEKTRRRESGESPVCATCRREHEANRSAEARERKKGTDGSSPQTTLITDSVYDIPGSESDHYGERHAEDAHSCVLPRVARNKNDASRSEKTRRRESGESPVCATCRREHEANRSAETASHYCDSLSTLTKVLKRVMTDPSIKSRHRKNKSRQMTMMMTPVKAQDDSAVAPRRAPQGTTSMSR
ncbi:hypothetical protein G5I_04796 [Acromyrmex echinatior]|uniref:Uncharacterized protein n=1 Tax=Acromyrmex echinatior TaxID=103372 RepID=F4WGL4_ACREC|nr:hypothetical protein G5I_04796 [Acromyrmex echinatior]